MMRVFIDTETTGKWDFKKEAKDHSQPHIIQIAAIFDKGPIGEDIISKEFTTIVKLPPGVKIDPGAARVHGITKEQSEEQGRDLESTLLYVSGMIAHADTIVCHNTNFDLRVLSAGLNRVGLKDNIINNTRQYCTMVNSTPICKLPGKYGYKWPSLNEAYRILVNPKGFEGAHDALVDVRACREIYYAMVKNIR